MIETGVAYRVAFSGRSSLRQLANYEIVYRFVGVDYGAASDDSRDTGVEHVAVTKKPNGDGPFFTIPVMDLVKESETAPSACRRAEAIEKSAIDLINCKELGLISVREKKVQALRDALALEETGSSNA